MNKLPRFAILIVYALVLMLIFAAVSRMAKTPQTPSVPYSQVVKLFEDEHMCWRGKNYVKARHRLLLPKEEK